MELGNIEAANLTIEETDELKVGRERVIDKWTSNFIHQILHSRQG